MSWFVDANWTSKSTLIFVNRFPMWRKEFVKSEVWSFVATICVDIKLKGQLISKWTMSDMVKYRAALCSFLKLTALVFYHLNIHFWARSKLKIVPKCNVFNFTGKSCSLINRKIWIVEKISTDNTVQKYFLLIKVCNV